MTMPMQVERVLFRRVRSRRLLQWRLTFSTAAGVFFLAESLNREFLRPAIASRTSFVHICIAIFGVVWLVQSFALIRQLQGDDLK